jgi:hypothetical protein
LCNRPQILKALFIVTTGETCGGSRTGATK